jgi:hypothetical protein
VPPDSKANLVTQDTPEREEQQVVLEILDCWDLLDPLDSLVVSESRVQLVHQVLQDPRVHLDRLEHLDSQDHPVLRVLLVTLDHLGL